MWFYALVGCGLIVLLFVCDLAVGFDLSFCLWVIGVVGFVCCFEWWFKRWWFVF